MAWVDGSLLAVKGDPHQLGWLSSPILNLCVGTNVPDCTVLAAAQQLTTILVLDAVAALERNSSDGMGVWGPAGGHGDPHQLGCPSLQ